MSRLLVHGLFDSFYGSETQADASARMGWGISAGTKPQCLTYRVYHTKCICTVLTYHDGSEGWMIRAGNRSRLRTVQCYRHAEYTASTGDNECMVGWSCATRLPFPFFAHRPLIPKESTWTVSSTRWKAEAYERHF